MGPQLVCSNYTFPLLPFEAVLDLVAGLEFGGIDIGLFAGSPHVDPDRVLEELPSSARQLGAQVRERGLGMGDMFLTPGRDFESLAINHPDAGERSRSREVFRRALEFTLESGGRHLTALPGAPFAAATEQENLDRAAEELTWRLEEAEKAGLGFAVEPHIGSIIPTPQSIEALLDRAPGLTLALDWAHLSCEGSSHDEIEPLIASTSHFHARCAGPGRLQAPMKENDIDFRRVLAEMARTGYRGLICVEYVWIEWRDCNQVDNVSETVLLRDLLRELVGQIDWEA